MNESYFIKKYVIRNASLIMGIALFIFVIFFVVALIYDLLEDDILISFMILGVGALIFIISLAPINTFQELIRMQENMFHITFSGNAAKPLHRNSLVYFSKDWIIIAGQYAFYREFIRDNRIMIHSQKTNRGNDYYIKIFGVNDQLYFFHVDSASTAKKIKAWTSTEDTQHDIN